jgi:hypothetical protein
MIAMTPIAAHDPNAPEDSSVRIWVTGRTDLLRLQALLNRSLNTAPELGADWFKLSDDLAIFLEQQGIKR